MSEQRAQGGAIQSKAEVGVFGLHKEAKFGKVTPTSEETAWQVYLGFRKTVRMQWATWAGEKPGGWQALVVAQARDAEVQDCNSQDCNKGSGEQWQTLCLGTRNVSSN